MIKNTILYIKSAMTATKTQKPKTATTQSTFTFFVFPFLLLSPISSSPLLLQRNLVVAGGLLPTRHRKRQICGGGWVATQHIILSWVHNRAMVAPSQKVASVISQAQDRLVLSRSAPLGLSGPLWASLDLSQPASQPPS